MFSDMSFVILDGQLGAEIYQNRNHKIPNDFGVLHSVELSDCLERFYEFIAEILRKSLLKSLREKCI